MRNFLGDKVVTIVNLPQIRFCGVSFSYRIVKSVNSNVYVALYIRLYT